MITVYDLVELAHGKSSHAGSSRFMHLISALYDLFNVASYKL